MYSNGFQSGSGSVFVRAGIGSFQTFNPNHIRIFASCTVVIDFINYYKVLHRKRSAQVQQDPEEPETWSGDMEGQRSQVRHSMRGADFAEA